ncbi:MAG: lipid-binding SYLF domain-containing protein [Desulfovibrionaceae bacterium]|nr:lipid-binding SYLF domain-containing protein [Desulfovibrionaceae bacterium]
MDMRHRHAWAALLILFLTAGCAAGTTGVPKRDAATARAMTADAEQLLERHLAARGGDELRRLIRRAEGMLLIPSAGEFGFLVTLGGGSGVLLANTDDGWTGPVFMGRGALGWGWQAGGYSQSGIVLFMHEKDVRYVLETGFIFQGQARLVVFSADEEYGRSPEFRNEGDVYFIVSRTGLFAGVSIDTGGYSNRPGLNAAFTGVAGGDPETVLYKAKARPEAAARLRGLIGNAALFGAPEKEKDGTEAPSQ